MPTKKGKKTVMKKKVTKQKQKQSQVQKVIVNIHKPTAKSSKGKASSKAAPKASSSSSSSSPIYQAESSPYPSYVRQAAPVAAPVTAPVAAKTEAPVAKTIVEEPADRTYVAAKKRRAEVPLFSKPPEEFVKRAPVKIFNPDNEFANLFKPMKQEPIKQEPQLEHTATYEKPSSETFSGENPMKEKRQYVKKKEGPRRNSADDLLNRFQAATGKPYDGQNIKVKTLKEIVEGLERFSSESKPEEEYKPVYYKVEDIDE